MMSLTEQQIAALRQAAASEGVDPDALVAAAREQAAGDAPSMGDGEPIKLFQYHLPFIRVRELRARWLGLDESIADDELPCGQWLEKHGGAMSSAKAGGGDEPPPAE